MRVLFILILAILAVVAAQSQISTPAIGTYIKGAIIFSDDFDKSLLNWRCEYQVSSASSITASDRKLVIDVAGGATVWFNHPLSGNIMITYKRTVIVKAGRNDRLSDLNQFWMATEPGGKKPSIRNGEFSEYDSLLLYYAGFGGNTNTTTRFRKYNGRGERLLLYDFTDKQHLLQPNKEYNIAITFYNGRTSFYVDGQAFFSYQDPAPLSRGYFAFRTTASRQTVSEFKVFKLK